MILMLAACDAGVEEDRPVVLPPTERVEEAPDPTGECIIPTDQFADGGVGKDGIPALTNPSLVDADRATIELVDDRAQQPAIHRIETVRVHLQHVHRTGRNGTTYDTVGLDLGIIAHPAQEPVRDTGRAARAPRDLCRAFVFGLEIQDAGGTPHDGLEFGRRIELEALHDAEAIPQRRGQQACPRRS